MDEFPTSFDVTDPDMDAPDGSVVFIEEYGGWYRRTALSWNRVTEAVASEIQSRD